MTASDNDDEDTAPVDVHDLRRRARIGLMDAARTASKYMSASAWLEYACESDAAKLLGPTELRAIVNVVWSL